MNTKNFFIGGIVGGVVYFLLGYLVYGNLLTQYYHNHPGATTIGVDRAMDQFIWWALILGNVLSGFLLSYVFSKSGVSSLSSGLITGGIVGLLMSGSFDSIMYATSNIISKRWACADVAAFTVISAITGAVVGAIMGMGKSKVVTA